MEPQIQASSSLLMVMIHFMAKNPIPTPSNLIQLMLAVRVGSTL
jgi:hypothetical protein